MRGLALLALCIAATVAAGCGEDPGAGASAGAPAAARDEGVQVAAPAAEPGAPNKSPEKVAAAAGVKPPAARGVLRGTLTRLNGARDDLSAYRGDVVLVVNTATECGYTPQFEGLEALYRERRDDGFVVLGFPANDFAGQEPRTDGEIAEFCKANYGVTFPMFAKSAVTGEGANPLFRALSAAAGEPEWNFNKYLVDRRGTVVARFGAGTEPDAAELTDRLDSLL